MKSIFAVSDLHNVDSIEKLTVPAEAEAVVIAGDIVHVEHVLERLAKPGRPMIVVAGNHDYYDLEITDGISKLRQLSQQYPDVHILDNDIVIIDGVRFVGSTFWSSYGNLHPRLTAEAQVYLLDSYAIKAEIWWSDEGNKQFAEEKLQELGLAIKYCKLIDFAMPAVNRTRFHPVMGYKFNCEAVEFVANVLAEPFEGRTVVVSHHPPTWEAVRIKYLGEMEINPDAWNKHRFAPGADRFIMGPLDPEIAAGYGSPLEEAFLTAFKRISRFGGGFWVGDGNLRGADVWIHGHVHSSFEYGVGGTRFVVNALDSYLRSESEKLIRIDDGMDYALDIAVKRAGRKLDDAIEQLMHWKDCSEIEGIKSPIIEEALLDNLESIYRKGRDALRSFELEVSRAYGVDIDRNNIRLFDINCNVVEFHQSPFDDDSKDPYRLSIRHIMDAVEKLENEKRKLLAGLWRQEFTRMTS